MGRAPGRYSPGVSSPVIRLLLVNPNTSVATTDAMLAVARNAASDGVVIEGATARFGEPLITDEAALAVAADAVLDVPRSPGLDGIIVAAFGDPGLDALRRSQPVPVTGIAEAAMAEAARHGRFVVVTTTPALAGPIARLADHYGHGATFAGVRLTPGDPAAAMADPARLLTALAAACMDAVRDGASAIVIGGGPLAVAARALSQEMAVPIIEPIPAAVRLASGRGRVFGMALASR